MTQTKSNGEAKDIFEIQMETSDRLLEKIEALLENSNIVWEGLGPDAINSIALKQGLDYNELEKEFRDRIVKAYFDDDLLTMGRLFYFLLSSYVQSMAIEESADIISF